MKPEAKRIFCIGGAAVDRKYQATTPIEQGTSNPVTSERSFGGVARNVAENIARLGGRCSLASVVGHDENGRAIIDNLRDLGVDTRLVMTSTEHRTAEYVAVLQPNGDLAVGLADMTIFDAFVPQLLEPLWPKLSPSTWVFGDCNLPPETLHMLIKSRGQKSFTLAIDAVSTSKVKRLPDDLRGVDLLFLNADEGKALSGLKENSCSSPHEMASSFLSRGVTRVVLTLGAKGLIAADLSGILPIEAPKAQQVNATGAGDALIATMIVSLMRGSRFTEAARLGTIAAALTIESAASTRPDLSLSLVQTALSRFPDLILE